MTAQEAAHLAIREAFQHSNFDYGIWSDGSGYTDGYAGYAVIIKSFDPSGAQDCRAAAMFGQDTERAEFEGLLAGLQAITEREIRLNGKNSLRFRGRKLLVRWVTDRESLALSVWRTGAGKTFYGRESSPDLWARMMYYEEFIEVAPMFERRKTDEVQDVADRIASEARILFKEWVIVQQADERFPKINFNEDLTTHASKASRKAPESLSAPADSGLASAGHAPPVNPPWP